jgi:hypothetical protein
LDFHVRLLDYCALVAVTTATDVGVATPWMAPPEDDEEDDEDDELLLPTGGETPADELPPPHPEVRTTKAMRNIAASSAPMGRRSD